ncbi:unnamed protein product [Adineta steineri]|uniref:Uncharacterized protein n=1 Tax=Adineta steineri TaxID=433720 RepID=A0A814UTC6_9BILA|nr:unnamed protein product [Adineta steineri]CAF1319789.1 unnamed protein product [Adineta steineri]
MVKFDQTIEPEKTNRFQLTEHGCLLTSDHPSKTRYLLYWGIKSKKYTTIQQAKFGNEFDKQNISKDRYQFISGDMFDATTIPQAVFNHDFLYSQEPTVNTTNILINPFFKPRSSQHTSESSTEIEQPQHNLSVYSQSQSSSLSSDRHVITSSNKEAKLVIQKKPLKSKHRRASIDRSDKKKDKLKRLYKEYSDENLYEHWKPLRTQQCSELYQYALDKYHQIE